MFSVIFSGGIRGMEAYLVRVEVDLSRGLPGFELVGSVSGEVKEAKERVQIALKNAGVSLPVARITINLSPANIRKEGTGYDLPIAAGLIVCTENIDVSQFSQTAFLGELTLNGEIKRVNGVLPATLALKKQGITRMVIPMENVGECKKVPGMEIVGLEHISDLLAYLKSPEEVRRHKAVQKDDSIVCKEKETMDFSEVCGQDVAKRAAEVAAAGFHHIMFAGPPGAGKTMIAERMPGLLPPLTQKERLEVSSIYSIAGKLQRGQELVTTRPFIAPHHTISPQALAGGGRIPRPGLLSLAHRGILFLDEMPEFSSDVLEVLRQPMEAKKVQIARSQGIYTYPADFMLVCAMNPCPCGYYPDKNKCTCSDTDIRRYLGRISGPILDRIDIVTEATPVTIQDFHQKHIGETTENISKRVMEARKVQKIRYRGTPYHFNGELPGREVERFCPLGIKEQRFLEQVADAGQMSARAYHKVIKLARTIADLAGGGEIQTKHLAEAVCYNSTRKRFWK